MRQRASAMEGRDAVSPEDFDECCRTLRSWLLVCIRRWGVPAHVAEEIAQDALVRLWLKGGFVKDPGAYLLKVAKNLAKDYWRKEQPGKHVSLEDLPWELAAPAPTDPDGANDGHARAAARRLKRLFKDLPKQQRTAMELVYKKRLTYKEAAMEMGISEGTLGKYLARAKATLAKTGTRPRSTRNDHAKKDLK